MLWLEQGLYVRIQELENGPRPLPLQSGFSRETAYRVLGTGYWDVLIPLKRQMPTTFLPMTAMKYGLSVTDMSVSSGWIMIVRILGTKSVLSYSRLGAGDGNEHN